MINKDELLYKLDVIINYLKDNKGYEYKLYNRVCPDNNIESDLDIVEYAEDVKNIVKEIIKKLKNEEN